MSFQSITTASQIVQQLARLHPDRVKQEQVFRATRQEAGKAVIGVTYFPPNNCDPRIVVPPAPKQHLMMAAAAAPRLPSYFCWADADNVAESKGWGKRDVKRLGPYTSAVPNQHTCGACWAVSSASVLSDRWAIYTQGLNPNLSATNILSCVGASRLQSGVGSQVVRFTNCDGCNGGLPAGAAALFAEHGVVSSECDSYNWCNRSAECSGEQGSVGGGGDTLNRLIPPCKPAPCANAVKYKCKYYTTTAPPMLASLSRPVQADSFTARDRVPDTSAALSITGVLDIQREIFANGPVVGAMAVFTDMQAGTLEGTGDGWAPTKGVYCNVQGMGPKPYDATPYAGTESQLAGYHAISVIGWGIERGVPDWNNPGATMDLPYWIVRNSWGPQWNAKCRVGPNNLRLPGHFKIAWSDRRRGINTLVFLDSSDNGQLGGCTSFEPLVARAPPPSGGKPVIVGADKYMFDGQRCVPAPDQANAQFDTLDACLQAHGGVGVTYSCKPWSNKCKVVQDGSGKYVSASDCVTDCTRRHQIALGCTIGGSLLVVAAIAIGVGVGVTRAKQRGV